MLQTAPNGSNGAWIRVFFCSTPLHPPLGVEHGAKQIGRKLRIQHRSLLQSVLKEEMRKNCRLHKPARIARYAEPDPLVETLVPVWCSLVTSCDIHQRTKRDGLYWMRPTPGKTEKTIGASQ